MNRFIFHAFLMIAFYSSAQSTLRKFSTVINHPAINVYAPYISADSRSLVYLSNNATDNVLTLFYTKKTDAVNWKEPVLIPKSTINGRLTFLRGFALSADGQQLYITSMKEGGLGGFDIHVSKWKAGSWSTPVNIGKPINSLQQEGAPSISSDGKTLYFMRCAKMNQKIASGCTLFMSKKNRMGRWEEPVALPDYINTGNSQVPRMLADGETLLFSSDRLPHNRGKMDLYLTRFDGYQWSVPVPLDFANTDENDQYVSVSAFGRYLLKDQPGKHKNEIVEILFPPGLKPKACMRVEGQVAGISDLSSPYVSVFDRGKNTQIYSGRPNKEGTFVVYLKEGGRYDLAVEPARGDYTFYAKVYDLTQNRVAVSARLDVNIEPVSSNTELSLDGIAFEPHTATITSASEPALRRLARTIKACNDYVFTIDVTFDGYQSDSVRSSSDLTEKIIDTIHFSITKQVPDTLGGINSIMKEDVDTVSVAGVYDSRIQQTDEPRLMSPVIDSTAVKTTYHNDRTALQAKAIIDYLVGKGILADRLIESYEADDSAIIEGRKSKTSIQVRMAKVE